MSRTLLPALVLLSSCNGELAAYLPTVSFNRLDVNDVDWEMADTNFVFTVDNPNPVDVTLASFDYDLAFGGISWASGDDPDGLTLGASGSSEVSLPVSVVFQDLYDMVQATRGEDTIDFELAGSFGFNTPLGLIELPYDAGGGFPALRTPDFAYDSVTVGDLSFSGATVNLNLNVDNAHASTLDFTNFAYAVSLEGYDIGEGSLASLGAVDGSTTGALTLPIEVDFGDAGYALYEALTSSKINVGLAASTDVDTPFGIVPLALDESGQVRVGD